MQVGSIPLLIAGLLVTVACGSDATRVAEETGGPTAPQPGTASTAGSCVELYSIDTLKKREYAFDGVVTEITPGSDDLDQVIFDVNRWFKGGSGDQATRLAYSFEAVTSAGVVTHEVGDRLLVAGDEHFVWECGFTQPYNESTASDWEKAFGP